MEASTPSRRIHFGKFEIDLESGELFKEGRPIHLQGQPVQILLMLLEKPGRVVTREELQQRLWPKDTFVDFEHSLNAAIKRLREALNDSAEEPRYIETLPRRGYRFNFPVSIPQPEAIEEPPIDLRITDRCISLSAEVKVAETSRHQGKLVWALAVVASLLVVISVLYWIRQPTNPGSETALAPVPFTTYPGVEWGPSFSPDGNQVAFGWFAESSVNSSIYIKQIGTESVPRLTTEPDDDFNPAWSPDGQSIAFERHNFESGTMAIWLIPVMGEEKLGWLSLQ